jgi:hypothetical protein
VNAGVYDRVKAGDDLLQILTTCFILHNMTIEDKEEYSEDNTAGTRNIISFDEWAPPSDMVQVYLPRPERRMQSIGGRRPILLRTTSSLCL